MNIPSINCSQDKKRPISYRMHVAHKAVLRPAKIKPWPETPDKIPLSVFPFRQGTPGDDLVPAGLFGVVERFVGAIG